jgi:hypothetical protein
MKTNRCLIGLPFLLASALARADDKVLSEADAVAALARLGATMNGAKPGKVEPPVRGVLFDPKKCQITDDDLRYLRSMPELRHAYIVGQKRVTGDGLKHLAGLKKLKAIDLDGTPVLGKHLAHLSPMGQLWKLGLWRTSVDDAGMAHLKGLNELEHLYLDETRVGDKGLAALGPKPKLRDLQYSDGQFSAEGKKVMKANFPRLGVRP